MLFSCTCCIRWKVPQMRYLQLLCNAKGLLDGNVARSQTEYTFLHIHHLTLPQHLHYFANLLTKHKVLFYFSKKDTVWWIWELLIATFWLNWHSCWSSYTDFYDYEAGAYNVAFQRTRCAHGLESAISFDMTVGAMIQDVVLSWRKETRFQKRKHKHKTTPTQTHKNTTGKNTNINTHKKTNKCGKNNTNRKSQIRNTDNTHAKTTQEHTNTNIKRPTQKNYFTSSDPHHDMLGGGRQVRVVIENMMGRMENLKTLISGFLGLVILVRWALVTMFLSWTTQTGCRIHRTYVSLIGSGEGRHTTHLLKCVLLLSTSQTDWKQSSDVLSDISFDILSDKSSDISSDILSDLSSDILSDIFLTYLLTFFLTNLLTLFLTYLLTFFLTYLSTCFLTYLLTFFLTYQNQNLTSTASHKKPLCKLYIYLTPRSKSNIHDNFVPVNVIALSASDRPAKRQLSPKMQNACSSTHTHTTCIRPPRQTAVESKNTKEFEVPQLHLMACANHEVRCSPLRFFRRICIGGPAPHVICLPLMHSILPKWGRSTKDCSALLQLLLALRIWNRPPFICHIPLVSLHDFFHDKHQIPSMCSARRLHAHVHALSTNTSQLVAPHMLNSFGHLIGSPNEDRLRTFHHNLRHGCQTKLTSLHKNKVAPTVLAAVCQIKQKTRCHPQDSVGANLNSCYPDLCTHIYLGHIFWHSAWHSFWLIFWRSSWHIF